MVEFIQQGSKMKAFFMACVLVLTGWSSAIAQSRIDVEITTGADDLAMRSYQGNIMVSVMRSAELGGGVFARLRNANRGEGFPSRSVRVISIPVPAATTIDELSRCYLSIVRSNTVVRNGYGDLSPMARMNADNWDIKKLLVTATLMENGVSRTYRLKQRELEPRLFRFRYHSDGGISENTLDFDRAPQLVSGGPTERARTSTVSNFAIELGTGGDDLGGGGNNATIVITVRASDGSTRTFNLPNVNQSRKIDNFQSYTHQVDLPAAQRGIEIPQIVAVGIRHDGGGGVGADNWDLDRFKISFAHNGAEKILVDLAGTPIFRFTGESRYREFRVEP